MLRSSNRNENAFRFPHLFPEKFFSSGLYSFTHIVIYYQLYFSQSLNFARGLYIDFSWATYVCFKILAARFIAVKFKALN